MNSLKDKSRGELEAMQSLLLRQLRQFGAEAIDGTLTAVRVQCRRPGCRCATDPARQHEKFHLTKTVDGKTVCTYIRKEQAERVRQQCESYRLAKQLLHELGAVNLALIQAANRDERVLRETAGKLRKVDGADERAR